VHCRARSSDFFQLHSFAPATTFEAVKTVHIPALPWEELKSPSGKFHSFCQNVSIALGAPRNVGTWGGGHPFDFQIRRIPPGAAVCPFHTHYAQSELYVVHAGAGTVRSGAESYAVGPGDVFYHPPGDPHQLTNTSTSDLIVYIIADHPPLEACHYPDSDKWMLRPPGKIFRMTEVDYFAGEDDAPLQPGGWHPQPSPEPPPSPPFSTRKVNIDRLPWEPWDSPKKKFRASSKELSIALGAKRNTPAALGGHSFDLELGKVPPGFSGCPFHSHATQWELYVFLGGTATVRTADATFMAKAGDAVVHPPGEAHQFTNTGLDDVLYYLIADNPASDYWHYPDSNKWGLRAPRKFFRASDADYWDGEE
jgi:uncharacterized cupin superfamily protein